MRRTSVIVVMLIMSAPLFPPTANAQNIEAAKLANLWTEAYNLRDVERLGALYTEGAHLYNHGRPRTVGRNNIRESGRRT